jgi:hypothetical protein
MLKKALITTKVNLRNVKPAFIVTGIFFGLMLANTIVQIILVQTGVFPAAETEAISSANFLYLLPILCGVLIPVRNFRKFINLGGRRSDFFKGCLLGYALLVAAVSLFNVAFYLIVDRALMQTGVFASVINLMDVFGWTSHGLFVAFLQQFAALFLATIFFHTLSALHEWWIGWVCDALIVACISVFTPIAVLRAAEYMFFRAILFHPSAILQIVTCLALALTIYALNKPILSRRII